jgi:hypothetical protein
MFDRSRTRFHDKNLQKSGRQVMAKAHLAFGKVS